MKNNIILSDKARYLLLTILENDGNVESIRKLGYDYSQITTLIKKEIELDNIVFNNGKVDITEKGLSLKSYLAKKLNYSNLETLISPQISDIIEEPAEDYFFIPSEKELPD